MLSAEYGDLKNKYGSISGAPRFCNVKDKISKDCQSKPYCSITLANICTDPAPQVENKTISVTFRCLDADGHPSLPEPRTVEAPGTASILLVSCSIPEDGFPSE
jgi:hypothetical protein